MRRILASIAAAALLLAAAPGTVSAQAQYTGCLDLGWEVAGRIWYVASGAAPYTTCRSSRLQQSSWRATPPKGAKGNQGPRGQRGAQGRVGERGTTGDRGVRGERGEHGTLPLYRLESPCQTCTDAGANPAATVSCDAGDVALGGGFITDGLILGSNATGDDIATGWSAPAALAAEGSNGTQSQLICHDLPPLRE